MNRFYTKQTKIYGNFRIWKIYGNFRILKDPKKLFVDQKINLEDTLIFGGEYSMFPNLSLGKWKWNLNTKNKKSEINTFKFHLFTLSSNSWMVRLKAINFR